MIFDFYCPNFKPLLKFYSQTCSLFFLNGFFCDLYIKVNFILAKHFKIRQHSNHVPTSS